MNTTLLPARTSGTLWGVGVGPGDPELLTLKAVRILRMVTVIAYPAPSGGGSLARRIAAAVLDDGVNRTEIVLRMRFEADRVSAQTAYDQGAAAIAIHLASGRNVAVLCEGDPLFFGSFAYLMARLKARFPVAVVPGVNSVAACSAIVQRPFAFLDDRAVVIPASRPSDEIEAALATAEAAAIIKVGRHLTRIADVLGRLDLTERAWHVERAGQPGEHIRPLTAALVLSVESYFSMILVHRRGERW